MNKGKFVLATTVTIVLVLLIATGCDHGPHSVRVHRVTKFDYECLHNEAEGTAVVVNPHAHSTLTKMARGGAPGVTTVKCVDLPEDTQKILGIIDPLLHIMHRYDEMMRRYTDRTDELPHGTPEHVEKFIKGCTWKRGQKPALPLQKFKEFVELPQDAVVQDHIAPPQSEIPADEYVPIEEIMISQESKRVLAEKRPYYVKAVDPVSAMADPEVVRPLCMMAAPEYCKLKIAVPEHCRPHVEGCN